MKRVLQILALFLAFEGVVLGVAQMAESRSDEFDDSACECESREPLSVPLEQIAGRYRRGDDRLELKADGTVSGWAPNEMWCKFSEGGTGVGFGVELRGTWAVARERVLLFECQREFRVVDDQGRVALCEKSVCSLWTRE